MLLRRLDDGWLAISQPMHAWLSGRIARAWGNGDFGEVVPREDVWLAADQHDLGFLDWDLQPTLDPAGRPHDFMSMPGADHVALWARGAEQMQAYSRYAQLLVSLHVTWLCQRYHQPESALDAAVTQRFLEEQAALQQQLRDALAQSPTSARLAAPVNVERNRRLIAAWDFMSLLLCLQWEGNHKIGEVPTRDGTTELQLAFGQEPSQATITPWPFSSPQLRLTVEGRRLRRSYRSAAELKLALRTAEPMTLQWRICQVAKPLTSTQQMSMNELAKKECVPCRGDVPPLKAEAIQDLKGKLNPGWTVVNEHHLEKEFKFSNFREALDFTNQIGELAEQQNHHPDIFLSWGRVKTTIWTHKIGGLSEGDFILAAKIDELK